MHHVRGHTQWSGDQLHVQKERWIRGLDERNFRHFDSYGFSNLVILQREKKDKYHRGVQESCTQEKNENCATIRAKNKSSQQ